MKRLACAVLGLLLCAGASGCLTVADDEGPILSIELYWDERPESRTFEGGTCRSAGVDEIEWRLLLHHPGEKDEVVAERTQACTNAIDVLEPDRGEYTLELTGRDDDGAALWNVECTRLTVLRFDVTYECDIDAQ